MTTVAVGNTEYETVLTRGGYERLRDELTTLTTISRAEISDRLRDAREHGGELVDNLELVDALEDQELLERRIATLEAALASATVVDEPPHDRIGIGSHVRLRDVESGRMAEYELVGSIESDPGEHRVSDASPVGRALLGRRPGDVVDVEAPRRRMRFEVLDIRGAARSTRSRSRSIRTAAAAGVA